MKTKEQILKKAAREKGGPMDSWTPGQTSGQTPVPMSQPKQGELGGPRREPKPIIPWREPRRREPERRPREPEQHPRPEPIPWKTIPRRVPKPGEPGYRRVPKPGEPGYQRVPKPGEPGYQRVPKPGEPGYQRREPRQRLNDSIKEKLINNYQKQ